MSTKDQGSSRPHGHPSGLFASPSGSKDLLQPLLACVGERPPIALAPGLRVHTPHWAFHPERRRSSLEVMFWCARETWPCTQDKGQNGCAWVRTGDFP